MLRIKRFERDKNFGDCNKWIQDNSSVVEVKDVQLRADSTGSEFVLLFFNVNKEDIERLK